MKTFLFCLLFPALAFSQSDLPDNPAPIPPAALARIHPISWKDTVSGRGSFLFWTAHTISFLANVADAEATHQGLAGCHNWVEKNPELPRHPSRGDLYRYNMLGWGGFMAADFLLRKAGIPIAPFAAPIQGTYVHVKGTMTWANHGCL